MSNALRPEKYLFHVGDGLSHRLRAVVILLCAGLLLFLCVGEAAAQAAAPSPTPSASPASAVDCAELPDLKKRVAQAEGRLRDWPNLGRYRAANAEVAAPAVGEVRVVFMGDSITDFWSRPGYGGFFPGKPYINRGISGQTTPQMLLRFRADVIALQPKVVVILAGTNDLAAATGPTTLAAIEDNLASMAELARAHAIRVVLASLLPVSDYERKSDGTQIIQTRARPPAQIKELNAWIKEYAERNGHTYLDYHTAMADDKGMLRDEFSNDGLHANSKGYAVMGPLAEAAIQAALKKK
ncbi:MAG TPA: SGNH/GDSL hydrolase family protein [Pyrinomonadaceae bacterium]|jgi:lysophospholipase L1-like esterase